VVDVSVIVIAHNVRDEVLEALRSVEDHRGGLAVETILVDNASTDGTIDAVATHFPRRGLCGWLGMSWARRGTTGFALPVGYRMFLDSDARLTAGALEELVRFLRAHPGVGMVGPRLVYPDGAMQYSARRYPPLLLPLLRRPPLRRFFEEGPAVARYLMRDADLTHPREVEYLITACVLFTVEAQEATGEMDPSVPFWEDADWCLSMRSAGYKIAYDPAAEAVHAYRRITAQRPLSADGLRHLGGFLKLRRKWRPPTRGAAGAGPGD
jgi:N-acetylglucosaminyl-diphospho-decaprenol L-rhamnosyltransferase